MKNNLISSDVALTVVSLNRMIKNHNDCIKTVELQI